MSLLHIQPACSSPRRARPWTCSRIYVARLWRTNVRTENEPLAPRPDKRFYILADDGIIHSWHSTKGFRSQSIVSWKPANMKFFFEIGMV